MQIEYGLRTHIGQIRTLNEDACAVANAGEFPQFAVVCDGMGGHQSGEIASGLAVRTVVEAMQRMDSVDMGSIRHAIEIANTRVYRHAISHEGCSGMGTTLVMAVFDGGSVSIANVGDSRAYVYSERDDSLKQVTTDHSLVEELISTGQLSKTDAESFPFKNIITRAVGSAENVKVDLFEIGWEPGDAIVLCSDGLNRHVLDESIRDALRDGLPAQQAADMLVEAANDAGGRDNITVAVARFCERGATG